MTNWLGRKKQENRKITIKLKTGMLEIFTIHTTRQFFLFLKILFPFLRRRPLRTTTDRLTVDERV
jgi:hypothetical protein